MEKVAFNIPEMARYNGDNYYKHFVLNSKNGDILSFRGNGSSTIGNTFVYKIIDGIYLFKTNAIFKDVNIGGLDSFADDALLICKFTNGSMLFLTEDEKEFILNAGDICNAASKFKMIKTHSFNKKVEYIGVMYYYKEMIQAIKNKVLDNYFLEGFYNSKIIRNVFIHRGNYKINKLFDEIEAAISNENKILIKAKALELLSESAFFFKNYIDLDCGGLSEEKKKLFYNIKEFLDNNLDKYFEMEFIADKFSISLSGLKNLFNEACGTSPYSYHLNKRLEKAAILLEETDYKINYIYKRAGFNYHSNFSKAFQKKYNCTPFQYRKRENSI